MQSATRRSATRRDEWSAAAGGFTLIELLVVILILGLIAALIVPQLGGTMDEARLRATSRQLATTLRYAASLAITTGDPHRVLVSEAERRFWIEGHVRPAESGSALAPVDARWERREVGHGEIPVSMSLSIEDSGASGGERGSRDSGSSADAGAGFGTRGSSRRTGLGELARSSGRGSPDGEAPAIQFFPDGTCEGAAIVLRDRAGDGLRVEVAARTARVRIDRATLADRRRR